MSCTMKICVGKGGSMQILVLKVKVMGLSDTQSHVQ
jgi:hypothetical protein